MHTSLAWEFLNLIRKRGEYKDLEIIVKAWQIDILGLKKL